jgi:hypothetical protein
MGEMLELAGAGEYDVGLPVVGPENRAQTQFGLGSGNPALTGLDVQHRRIVLVKPL